MSAFPTPYYIPPRLLLISQDCGAWRLCQRLMQMSGYQVQTASDVRTSLRQLDLQGADVIVVDATGPDLDGIQACIRIRRRMGNNYLPLLLITRPNDTATRAMGRRVGCTDFLSTPVEEHALLLRVQNYSSLGRSHRRLRSKVEELLAELKARAIEHNRVLGQLERSDEAIKQSHKRTLERLAHATELRDDQTGQHTRRVGAYAQLLAERVGFGKRVCEMLGQASPLHDVGKIGIPDCILLKPSALTTAEFEVVKSHPQMGYDMLTGSDSMMLDMAARIALTHHEKYDGSGYPNGLVGDDIPIEGRITAIADVFDALTSERSYKRAFSIAKSVEIMRAGRGAHFDPTLLDLFIHNVDRLRPVREHWVN